MKRHFIPLTLALCVLGAPTANAESALGLGRIGAAVGFVSPEGLNGTFSLGAFADWGTVAPDLGLESRIDYWSFSENVFGFESSVRDIALGARGKYWFDVANAKVRPFAGAGLAAHFIRSEFAIPDFYGGPPLTFSGTDTKIGVDLGGGFATALSPRHDLLGEVWYGIVSDVSQLSLRVGLSYKLGS